MIIVDRPKGSTFAYTEDNHTSVLGMRELASGANLLCLTRNKAHEILDKIPSSKKDYSACSSNSLFVYPAQSNFCGTKYPLKWIETCRNGALNECTDNCVRSRLVYILQGLTLTCFQFQCYKSNILSF